ncbi:hypothetical protein KI387_011297, partial [Taxus chinensis]
MLKALVDQDLEHCTDIVLKEGKEESVEKEHDSLGGPALILSFPKGMNSGRRTLDTEQRQVMGYVDDTKKVLCAWFQITIPTERLLAMGSFEKDGVYPKTKKMLSWAFKSHIDEPEFEVYQKVLILLLESKGDNPL